MTDSKPEMLNETDMRIPLDDERIQNKNLFREFENMDMFRMVGAGGSSLVYLARVNGQYGCVIKEYYPAGETLSGASYIRDMKSGKISLEGSEQQQQLEKVQQEKQVQYECDMINQLYGTTDDPGKNNNHILHFQNKNEFYRIGDTVYVVLQTTNGCTLYDKVQQLGHFPVEEAIDTVLKLVAIIKAMLTDKACLHGDIKPENIWMGSDDASSDTEVLYLIDFGSSFFYNMDLQEVSKSEETILKRADEIAANPGIACSSKNYCSFPLYAVYRAKERYLRNRNMTNAKKLLRQISQINGSSDLFSIMKTFYFMIAGEDYNVDTPLDDDALAQVIACQKEVNWSLKRGIAKRINQIMRKNDRMEYSSALEVRRDLQIVKAMCRRQTIPEVWIESVVNGPVKEIPDFDPLLMCSVKNETK